MSDAALLPTTRDEDWRYADGEWLAAADPAYVGHWRTLDIAPGESKSDYDVHASGGDATAGTVDRLRVHVGKGGRYALFITNAAGPYARHEIEVTLEEGAHFEFGGVTLGGGDYRQEFVTRVNHAPRSTSNQVVRCVQWGRSVGNFLGRIEIPRDSQQVDAAQNFRAILLEAGASANAKPELEIFADDVKAAHGAAIGALDERAAFYMASRGIAPHVARKLLLRAFVADAFEAIADDAMREHMLEQTLERLDEGLL